MLTLIAHGELYDPAPRGRASVLLVGDRVAMVGVADRRAVEAVRLELVVVDATGCVVTPGFLDPHEHLLGGSGEEGVQHTDTDGPAERDRAPRHHDRRRRARRRHDDEDDGWPPRVLRRDSRDVAHVFARGRHMVDDGRLVQHENWLATSRRRIDVTGQKR